MVKLGTRSLAAPLLLIAAATGGGCQVQQDESNQANVAQPEPPAPRLPAIEPPIDRAALLQAVAAASSAAALGRDDRDAQRKLDGKAFEIRIRFGCPGGAAPGDPEAAPFKVRFEPEDRTLRISAAPDLTLDDPRVAAVAGEAAEAVEGFWMRRPWLLIDGCPAGAAPAPVKAAADGDQAQKPAAESEPRTATNDPSPALVRSEQRVGLAQVFLETDSRIGRRDHRAYEATSTLGAGEQPSPDGYNLVLSGRLRKLASGRVVTCQIVGRDAPPDCIVSAEFDRAWIEHPKTRAIVAEWSS